ncbi:MAG: MBL fold metallo-hydrolase [Rhodothalassiaceae bacterium]|nr:MAG: MBL fold metallo-hydrolase [Rhodothalassiaceae bacterium]
MAAAGPEAVFTASVRPGVPTRVSALVEAVLAPNPGPFTFTGTQTFIVSAGGAAVVIDPGPDDPRHLDALLAALGGRPVSHILVTHTHRDHSPLASALAARTGAPVLAFGPHGAGRRAPDPALAPVLEAFAGLEAGADTGFRPDRTLGDGAVIAGEGVTLEARHTPGHAANHLCFLLEEERILFTGDHVMGWSTTVIAPPDGDMRAYLASLARLMTDPRPRLLLPTHGPAVRHPRRHVAQLIAHRRMREELILGALAAGARDLDSVVVRAYPGLDPRLKTAAAASALAHLLALAADGRLELAAGGGGRIRISPLTNHI